MCDEFENENGSEDEEDGGWGIENFSEYLS